MTARLLHDSINNRKAETRTATHFFRREEGLEDLRIRRCVHPVTLIAHTNHCVRPGREIRLALEYILTQLFARRVNREMATIGHRVRCVNRKVHHNLLKLPRVDANEWRVGRELSRDADA